MTIAAPIRFQRIILTTLIVVIAGLAVANWRVLESPLDAAMVQTTTAPTTPGRPSLAPRLESPAVALAQAKDHEAILDRPLFDASRRPPTALTVKPPPPPPQQAKFPADRFRLVGIMRSNGTPPQALIRINANDPGLWIAEGGLVGGWRVERVGEDKVEFSASGATGSLKFIAVQAASDQTSAATATPAPAPANAASAPAPATTPAAKK